MLTKELVKQIRLARELNDARTIEAITRRYLFADDDCMVKEIYEADEARRLRARAQIPSGTFETRNGWRVK